MTKQTETAHFISIISRTGTILLLGSTVVAMAIIAISGSDAISENTPLAIAFIIAIGLGLTLLFFAAVSSFVRALEGKG